MDDIENMFLPGGLKTSQIAAAEWVVEFLGKDENYTSAAMKDAGKDRPWCKLPPMNRYATLYAHIQPYS